MNRIRFFLPITAICAVLAALFVWAINVPVSVPERGLSAQVIDALNAPEAAKKRIGNLVERQRKISRRLDNVVLTSTPGGTREGQTVALFEELTTILPFETADNIIEVHAAPEHPLTFIELSGLSTPFAFKGEAYPGTGGTCPLVIAKNCTLVLEFKPNGAEGETVTRDIRMRYTIGGVEKVSNTLRIRGRTEFRDPKSIRVILGNNPRALVGESAEFELELQPESGGPFHIKSAVAIVDDPFKVAHNGCSGIQRRPCKITIRFSPTRSGVSDQQAAVGIDIGDGAPLRLTIALSAQGIPAAEANSSQVLVVYNEEWPDSEKAKEHYRLNRPGMSNANILPVRFSIPQACSGNDVVCLANNALEVASLSDIQHRVAAPIVNWLKKNASKDVQYIVLMNGLPSVPGEGLGEQFSVQHFIRQRVLQETGRTVYITSLDTGTLESTIRYIDKLQSMHPGSPGLVISGRTAGRAGTTYYFSDSYLGAGAGSKMTAQSFMDAVKAVNSSAEVVPRGNVLPVLSSASDVAGFFIHGIYGYDNNGRYAIDGAIRFSGKSGWYVMTTGESFNGSRHGHGGQGNFTQWFSKNAFGGSDYEYTPVAATTRVVEEGDRGFKTPGLFACWEAGKPFAYCAWETANTERAVQAIGDPLITR